MRLCKHHDEAEDAEVGSWIDEVDSLSAIDGWNEACDIRLWRVASDRSEGVL